MIVVLSQNKEMIIECKNIQVEGEKVLEFNTLLENNNNHASFRLGTYATEERAKEVVAEIWSIMTESFVANKAAYFKMPEE